MRLMVAVGVSLFALSCFMNSGMTDYSGIDQLRWSQLVRAMGQPLIITPISSIARANIKPQEAGSASALFNMMRNLGGSMGIAAIGTVLTNREQFHSARLGESISAYNPLAQQRIDQMTQYFISRGADSYTAHKEAIASIANNVRQEAFVLAFNDCFYLLGIALLLSGIATIFLRKVKAGGGAAAH